MAEISATIRLRPTRIGFLARPTDMASVRKIMRACTCIWGGIYNPIIPVFRTPPKEWRTVRFERVKGIGIAKSYIDYFEPDVFVESEIGLLEQIGLGALREKYSTSPHVTTLNDFLATQDHRDWSEPAFGLNIIDVYRHLYETVYRFQASTNREAVLIKPEPRSGLVEALFGAFPTQKHTDYIVKAYKDIFNPTEGTASAETWVNIFKQGAVSPLQVTKHGLDLQRHGYRELHVYVFDPARSLDVIDLWNLRLKPHPVLPVPIEWFENLTENICEAIKAEHRPMRGNPQGLMYQATVAFAPSIDKNRAEQLTNLLKRNLSGVPFGVAVSNLIWVSHTDDPIPWNRRLEVTADEQRTSLEVKEGQELTAKFATLGPTFASRYGGHDHRWINAVRISNLFADKIATVLPFNMYDRTWPRLRMLGEKVIVGREGLVCSQRYQNSTESLILLTMEDAIIGSLERFGIQAKLSDPGHVAKQMLEHLGGLWDIYLLTDLETLTLLNKMAGGVRRRSTDTETIEETFDRRSAPVKDWVDLIARRKQRRPLPALELADFTKRNIIRLGLETGCPNCKATNWHSLTAVDYGVTCDRCLKRYDFPQAGLSESNRNWHYRVIGPFSVPDYGRGSYSALLTLRVINQFSSSWGGMTFTTAMNLKFDHTEAEADFVAWRADETHGIHTPPELIIGETKSLGQNDLIKPKDVVKLKAIARKLPGSILVISVLREKFTDSEKALLQRFVKWCRRPDSHGRATNPVILLTRHELFFEDFISATWKELGEPFNSFADFEYTRNLYNFAVATQQIYLGLPSIYEWRATEWKKRAAKRNRMRKGS